MKKCHQVLQSIGLGRIMEAFEEVWETSESCYGLQRGNPWQVLLNCCDCGVGSLWGGLENCQVKVDTLPDSWLLIINDLSFICTFQIPWKLLSLTISNLKPHRERVSGEQHKWWWLVLVICQWATQEGLLDSFLGLSLDTSFCTGPAKLSPDVHSRIWLFFWGLMVVDKNEAKF